MLTDDAQYGVLVAVDGTSCAEAAVRWAARAARLHGLPITVMHVVAPILVAWPEPVLMEFIHGQDDNARVVIERARALIEHAAGPNLEIRSDISHADVVPTLVDASSRAALLVVGSHGHGPVGRALLGSVSAGVVHHAHCPVAIVHDGDVPGSGGDGSWGDGSGSDGPVVVGIDGTPASEAAIALAFDEASRRRADLVAVYAWSDVGIAPFLGVDWHTYEGGVLEVLAERLAGWQEQYPDVRIERRVVCDKPAHWLIVESKGAQLVVVGRRGRRGFPGLLLGSVSSAVAQSAQCPVIVVRG